MPLSYSCAPVLQQAIWIRISIESTRAIDLDKKKKNFKSQRASSQWRLDGYTSFEETSTGNPYITSSENYLLGKATRGGPQASEGLMGIPVLARPLLGTLMLMNYFFWFCHWWQGSTGSPESCLACLLAHGVSSSSSWPLHLVSLLFCDSKVCKERQKIWYNWCSIIKLFFYISKERCEDTILVCHGWLHYRKWRHSSNRTDPQGDVIVTSWQNKTKQSSGLEETICTMVTWTIDRFHGYEVTIKSLWWPLVKRQD